MNKQEFLNQLEQELASLPNDERSAALQYFTMYFEDAGPEREQEVIQELKSPQSLADDIKSSSGYDFSEPLTKENFADEKKQTASFVNSSALSGEQSSAVNNTVPLTPDPQPSAVNPVFPTQNFGASLPPNSSYNSTSNGYATATQPVASTNNTTFARVVLLIILSPLWISLLACVFGLIISSVIVLAIPLFIGIVFIFAAIALFIFAFSLFPFSVVNSIYNIGVAIVLLALGFILIWSGALLLKKTVPALFKGLFAFARVLVGGKG